MRTLKLTYQRPENGEHVIRYATKRAKDYRLADGEGLYPLVRPNSSKRWRG